MRRHGDRWWAAILFSAVLGACGGDGGGPLSRVESAPEAVQFFDLWVFAEDDIWFVDGTNMVHRYDGDSFSTMDTGALAGHVCIYALSPNQIYLCSGSEVLFYDGTSFTAMDVSPARGLDGLTDLWVSGDGQIWAIGSDAIVAHYNGSEWTGTIVGSPFPSSIWGSGPDDVYVLNTFSLDHYDGTDWSEIDLDSLGDGQVWGISSDDVWLMTDRSELSHFDGASWEVVEPDDDSVGDLAAVWGVASDDLWAVGSFGSVARWHGESWKEVGHQSIGSPFLRQFTRIHGSSADNIWAVGYQLGENGSKGIIYRANP